MASELEDNFAGLWDSYFPDIDLYTQYKFHPKRRWMLDFACPVAKVGIEIQGGIWMADGAGHSTGKGITTDCEKFCNMAALGWLLFPLVDSMIEPDYLAMIANTIKHRKQFAEVLGQLNEVQNVWRI
jgi:very-short-patch-repair endonuclease